MHRVKSVNTMRPFHQQTLWVFLVVAISVAPTSALRLQLGGNSNNGILWFDVPFHQQTYKDISAIPDLPACVEKCKEKGGKCTQAAWTTSDLSQNCRLFQESAQKYPGYSSRVLVRSNDEVGEWQFQERFGAHKFRVFPVPEEWCFLADKTKMTSMDKCQSLCENKKNCGRVSYSGSTKSCRMFKDCGAGTPGRMVMKIVDKAAAEQ